jgi:hypothetical protein
MTNDRDEEIARTNKHPAEIIAKALNIDVTDAETGVIALHKGGYILVPNELLSTIEKMASEISVALKAFKKWK